MLTNRTSACGFPSPSVLIVICHWYSPQIAPAELEELEDDDELLDEEAAMQIVTGHEYQTQPLPGPPELELDEDPDPPAAVECLRGRQSAS